ncbi:MAG: prolyl oligopeptidase family serine peptidase [Ancalomicrobiaceae bacterium]|nr:prolyl oligopeptidase family serine peptidase [Ancalomicrobiaceae bacterium]
MAVGTRRLESRRIVPSVVRALPNTPRVAVRLWLAAVCLLLAGIVAAEAQEGVERFSVADLVNGKTVGEYSCNATSTAVWVTNAPGGPACIRYYFSDAGGQKSKALVFLPADFTLVGSNGRVQVPAEYAALSPSSLTAEADGWSRRYGGPVIILARPGTLGSSGREVMESGTRREVDLVDLTLDAIKDRHALDGFDLAGLGEGGNIAATLGVKRQDIGCAVTGSSPLSRLTFLAVYQSAIDPILLNRLNDPIQALGTFRPSKGLRLIAMVDAADRPGIEGAVSAYVAAARDAGLQPLALKLPNGDAESRGRRIIEAGIRCGLGESDRAIMAALAQQLAAVQPGETRSPMVKSPNPTPQTRPQAFEPREAAPLSAAPPTVPSFAPPFEPPRPQASTEATRQAPLPQVQEQSPLRLPSREPPSTVTDERQGIGPRDPARQVQPQLQQVQPHVQAALPPSDKSEGPVATPVPGERRFSRADVLAGVTIDEPTCLAMPFAVWVTNVGSPECIRYYYSAAGGQGARALLFMNGDFTYLGADGQPTVDASYDEIGPKDMQRIADVRSKDYGGPMVYLARPGTLGSSGNELKLRHTPREVALVSAAIAEIKRRHLISTFDVVGQSGGGLLLGALVAMRNDIGCAISSSGVLATNDWVSGRLKVKATHDGTLYDPIDHVGDIRPGPDFRFFILTDAEDQRVPPQSTEHYVKALQAQGVAFRRIGVNSTDPAHHDLALHGIRAAIACAHGALDTEIASLLTKTVVTQPHMSEMSPIGEMPKAGNLAPARTQPAMPQPFRRPAAPLPQELRLPAPQPPDLRPPARLPQEQVLTPAPQPLRTPIPAPMIDERLQPNGSETRGSAERQGRPLPGEDMRVPQVRPVDPTDPTPEPDLGPRGHTAVPIGHGGAMLGVSPLIWRGGVDGLPDRTKPVRERSA